MSNPLFQTVKVTKPGRSAFNLSHEVKLSAQFGALVPIFCQEALPGDTFKLNSELFIRMAPMLAPIMHRVNVYTHFFCVPMRLIWDDWEEFITGGRDGLSEPVFPRMSNYIVPRSGSLLDYLGYPSSLDRDGSIDNLAENDEISSFDMSILPLRAYHLIWNEYYRDQNLSEDISESPYMHQSGVFKFDAINKAVPWFFNIRYRAWEKDYFTSALPWSQRGAEAVIPLSSDMTVEARRTGHAGMLRDVVTGLPISMSAGNQYLQAKIPGSTAPSHSTGRLSVGPLNSNTSSQGNPAYYDPDGSLYVDGKQTAAPINELRRAFALQRFLERNAVGGARYIEQIMAHFGVTSSDARLQRPEYLGGGKSPVVISEVLQTSQTTQESAGKKDGGVLGDMAGRGISVGKSHSFTKFFEEHCIVMGIMSILPRSAYMQGVSRFLTKFDKYDYYFPEFAHLGEQEVFNRELFVSTTTEDTQTFGYQSRYAEYKFINSHVHGKFKTDLSYWHLARVFKNLPKLNSSFIQMSPAEAERIFPVQVKDFDTEHFYCQIYNNFRAIRPIPKYSTPGL